MSVSLFYHFQVHITFPLFTFPPLSPPPFSLIITANCDIICLLFSAFIFLEFLLLTVLSRAFVWHIFLLFIFAPDKLLLLLLRGTFSFSYYHILASKGVGCITQHSTPQSNSDSESKKKLMWRWWCYTVSYNYALFPPYFCCCCFDVPFNFAQRGARDKHQ